MRWELPIGAQPDESGVRFRVWAPDARTVDVVILGANRREKQRHALNRTEAGYFSGHVPGIGAGARYMYLLDGDRMRPDPASRYQPESVHGASQVVDPRFNWTDDQWRGVPLEEMVIYEAHIGTATPQGTFEAFIEKLPYLRSLGVTAIEIMPVADFPGERNWGYDGVHLFAAARAYGGPEGYRRLVDAAHARDLAVIQDVVYNHLGPDGNYLRDFSRDYFTAAHKTPWGDGLNFERREVRDFFISNALFWALECHVDGLRLDATHAMLDSSEEHILWELPRKVREALPEGRRFAIMAEDERNEARLLAPPSEGGAALDAVWADDFHHQVRSALAGDNEGYYQDYTGSSPDLAETLNHGWFYRGQRSAFHNRPRGTDATRFDPPRFVFCIQNHDQIGNRAAGDRLNHNITPAAYRAASALLLLSPYTPLLFQGQEWAASTPFLFFTDHNEDLGRLVTEGRRAEFKHFEGFEGEQVPDPQSVSTFLASKLPWDEAEQGEHGCILALYRELLSLRRGLSASQRRRDHFQAAHLGQSTLAMRYRLGGSGNRLGELLVVVNLAGNMRLDLEQHRATRPPHGSRWQVILSTEEARFGGAQSLTALQDAADQGVLAASGPVALLLGST